jgi:hypothetical protein
MQKIEAKIFLSCLLPQVNNKGKSKKQNSSAIIQKIIRTCHKKIGIGTTARKIQSTQPTTEEEEKKLNKKGKEKKNTYNVCITHSLSPPTIIRCQSLSAWSERSYPK